MKYILILILCPLLAFSANLNTPTNQEILKNEINTKFKSQLITLTDKTNLDYITQKCIPNLLNTWDGSFDDLKSFVLENLTLNPESRKELLLSFSKNYEILSGHLNDINLGIKQKTQLDMGELTKLDEMFSEFDPYSHLQNDLYSNKIAYLIALNFPNFTLKEKTRFGKDWTSLEWAYARLGDMFTGRIPSEINANISKAQSMADNYIAQYYIFMGNLVDDKGNTFFPKDMKLISHWNLRDELKSNYGTTDGISKQKKVYTVMKHIIAQDIPKEVINNPNMKWNPDNNKVFSEAGEVKTSPEPNTRYWHLLNNYKALREVDKLSNEMGTYIDRKFNGEYEIPQKDIEDLFVSFVSSPVVKEVATLIKKRLGRDLEPFDIWYDGFKARSAISEEDLSNMTRSKYKSPDDFKKELPTILTKLGFNQERADFISSKVDVDPSRGAGHAAPSDMKSSNSHLRTRVGKNGMDYKGYNIAVHEFGHNVEQTISLHDVDYYMMRSVPNNAFTEAIAFVFQQRDLDLLGIKNEDKNRKNLYALDNFWNTYEIMGVSLVDMRVWKWLYENPEATPETLNKAVNQIAKDVWNEFYAPVIGKKDETILGIYSHMIDYPLYLSGYPIGHLIEFQLEQQIEGKNLAKELQRICKQGRLIPQVWMEKAVGSPISAKPILEAAHKAVGEIK
jgi:hypothetical protein